MSQRNFKNRMRATRGQMRSTRASSMRSSRSAARSARSRSSRSHARVLQRHPHEAGYLDLPAVAYPMDSASTVTLLNPIPVGAGSTQRVGKRVALKSLQLRGVAYAGTTATQCHGVVLVVYDKRPTGSIPVATDILTGVSPQAMNNDDNSDRFRIVRRMNYELVGQSVIGAGITSSSAFAVDEYVPLKMKPTVFKSVGTGAIGDIEQGALYLVTLSDQVPGTPAGTFHIATRVRYVDI